MRVVLKAIQRRMQRNSERSNANHNKNNNNTSKKNQNKNHNDGIPTTVDTPKPSSPPPPQPQAKKNLPSVNDYHHPQDLPTLRAVLRANDPNRPQQQNHRAASVVARTIDLSSHEDGTNGTTGNGDDSCSSSLGDHSGGMVSNASSERSCDDPLLLKTSSSSFQPVEWTLPLVDPETSEPQTMEQEFQRLQVLQSYFILDAQGEVEFDRITQHAAKLFQVPIALISLVDLGRQWLLSKVGIDDATTEAPRQITFCAHTILQKQNRQLIVPDATKDVRFQHNPFVADPAQGGMGVRFYAGAALVSPEGYKLGTLCLLDLKARPPPGLTAFEQEQLHDLAAMVVSTMVARRTRLLKEEYEHKFLQLAQTLLDTHHALIQTQTCIQNVLDRQQQEGTKQLGSEEQDDNNGALELKATVQNLALQSQICAAATRSVWQDVPSLRQQHAAAAAHGGGAMMGPMDDENDDNTKTNHHGQLADDTAEEDPDDNDYANMPPQVVTTLGDNSNGQNHHGQPQRQQEDEKDSFELFLGDTMLQYDKIVNPCTDMQKLYDNLNTLVAQFPHSNMVTVELYKSVPKFLMAEDLLLFRSLLNLITHCMGASQFHSCGLRICNKKTSHGTYANELLIHCLQGGPLVPYVRAKELFHNPDSLLAPVATMVRTMGGQYGMFQGRWDRPKPTKIQQRNSTSSNPHSSENNKNGGGSSGDPTTTGGVETSTLSSTAAAAPRGGKLQSIYWLQIPYELPGEQEEDNINNGPQPLVVPQDSTTTTPLPLPSNSKERFRRTQLQVHRPLSDEQASSPHDTNNTLNSDPFLKASLFLDNVGCGNHGTPTRAATTPTTAVPRSTASRA
ncbi:hypothetical protein ACA910_016203 [Epithemia clementina (nom. ined.)]